jgi:hypothetical protein
LIILTIFQARSGEPLNITLGTDAALNVSRCNDQPQLSSPSTLPTKLTALGFGSTVPPTVRKLTRLAFLLFYVASSYAVGQERTRIIVRELEHSSSREDRADIDSGCERLVDSFPKYRQAKLRANSDLFFGSVGPIDLQRGLSEHSFAPQVHSLKSVESFEDALSRAPPSA